MYYEKLQKHLAIVQHILATAAVGVCKQTCRKVGQVVYIIQKEQLVNECAYNHVD